MWLQYRVQDSCLTATASAGSGKPAIDVKRVRIPPIPKGSSNPARKALKNNNKLSSLCLIAPVDCVAGRQELGQEARPQQGAVRPPWPRPLFPCPFPPPLSPKHPLRRGRKEQTLICSLFWVQGRDKTYGKDHFFAGWRTVSNTAGIALVCAMPWVAVIL